MFLMQVYKGWGLLCAVDFGGLCMCACLDILSG